MTSVASGARAGRALPYVARLRTLTGERLAFASAAFLIFVALCAVLAPFITRYGYATVAPIDSLQAPSLAHPMGTDQLGRDIFARVLYGARLSLLIGLSATALGGFGGSLIGIVAGYFGGWLDEVLMRIVDIMLAFPGTLLAMGIVAMLGPSIVNLIAAVGIAAIPGFARLMRSTTLGVRSAEYVLAAEASGCTPTRIIRRHIVRNSRATFITYAMLSVSTAILYASALGFLGLGSKPPTPEWGLMVADGRDTLALAWWVTVFPGLAIVLTVLALNLLGDGLNAIMNPRRMRR